MIHRTRRAARELRGYLERLYGPQPALVVAEAPGLVSSLRIYLSATGVSAPRPEGGTYSGLTGDFYTSEAVGLVTRLAVKLVAIRSERYTPSGGLVPVTYADGADDLGVDFGGLFPPGTVEVDVPWQEVLRAGAEVMHAEELLKGLATSQAKTKFASLHWYHSNESKSRRQEVNSTTSALEFLSTAVCETCGAPGTHRRGGWHVIACDPCQEERDKRRRKRGG